MIKFQRSIVSIFILVLIRMIVPPISYSQEVSSPRVEKRLSELYIKDKWKKCNKVAKKFIKHHRSGDSGLDSALFFTSLTYADYPYWNWTNWRIMHGRPWIMDTNPINYIDSAFKYNDLFLIEVGSLQNKKGPWHDDFFLTQYINVSGTFVQLRSHKYDVHGSALYEFKKQECDSVFAWYRKLYDISKIHFKEYSAFLYGEMIQHRFELGIMPEYSQLDTLFEELLQFNENYYSIVIESLHHTEKDYKRYEPINFVPGSILVDLMEIDTSWFYKFLQLYERDEIYTFWTVDRDVTNFFEDQFIFQLDLNEVDLGLFEITDSVRLNMLGFEARFDIPFSYNVFPGDTLSILQINKNNISKSFLDVNIINQSEFVDLTGQGSDTLKVLFSDNTAFAFKKSLEWEKYTFRIPISTNRGIEYITLIYRYKYVD